MSDVGFNTYERIKKLESVAQKMGFRLTGLGRGAPDIFILKPNDDESLPVFNKDLSLFGGNLEQTEAFLHGIEWARDYDTRLGLRTSKTRPKAEQKVRNRRLIKMIKGTADGKKDYPF